MNMLQIADFVFEHVLYLIIPSGIAGIIGFLLLSFSSGAGFSLRMTMHHLSQLDFKNELTKIGSILLLQLFVVVGCIMVIDYFSYRQARIELNSLIKKNEISLRIESLELPLDLADTLSLYLKSFKRNDGRKYLSKKEIHVTAFSNDKKDSIYLILQKDRKKEDELWVSYKLNKDSFKEWEIGKIPIYNPLLLQFFE